MFRNSFVSDSFRVVDWPTERRRETSIESGTLTQLWDTWFVIFPWRSLPIRRLIQAFSQTEAKHCRKGFHNLPLLFPSYFFSVFHRLIPVWQKKGFRESRCFGSEIFLELQYLCRGISISKISSKIVMLINFQNPVFFPSSETDTYPLSGHKRIKRNLALFFSFWNSALVKPNQILRWISFTNSLFHHISIACRSFECV